MVTLTQYHASPAMCTRNYVGIYLYFLLYAYNLSRDDPANLYCRCRKICNLLSISVLLSFQALADIVHNHLSSRRKSSVQFSMRCPECTNPVCEKMRDFFLS